MAAEGDHAAAGLYVCGWRKRGPNGTIGANRGCSSQTAEAVLSDLPKSVGRELADAEALIDRLAACVGGIVDFADWARIDAAEVARGAPRGKPREKFVSIAEMLAAAAG